MWVIFCATCLFLNDLSRVVVVTKATRGSKMASREALYYQIAELERLAAHRQFLIDSLMLEYCPDEMTEEQVANYEKHQTKAIGAGSGE